MNKVGHVYKGRIKKRKENSEIFRLGRRDQKWAIFQWILLNNHFNGGSEIQISDLVSKLRLKNASLRHGLADD